MAEQSSAAEDHSDHSGRADRGSSRTSFHRRTSRSDHSGGQQWQGRQGASDKPSAGSVNQPGTGLLDRLGQTANTPLTFDDAPPIRDTSDHPAFDQPGRRARCT